MALVGALWSLTRCSCQWCRHRVGTLERSRLLGQMMKGEKNRKQARVEGKVETQRVFKYGDFVALTFSAFSDG